ncbi:hypothetical protein [Sphingomonas koreensis]|uniref:hypothetical protein n=1 Tax=Sphingomonas koreensis TaxID=93064 RepID=UPI00234F4BD8|nr:hypothetical protein [Sphingomonas koreensis]MDC7812179.1 hypothetical protein [Sphingomonas koreensis]
MAIPEPVPGLVIRYAYLWSHEAKAGHEEGSKDRPCAILLTAITKAGAKLVTVLPVTHSPPADPKLAVEIPAATKARLGLDDERSWVILTELNHFQWPGPDLRPTPGDPEGDIAYGLLPASLYETIRTRWLAAYDAGKIAQVKRTS